MAEIRLSKLIKQFSVGLDALVDFLNTQGYNPPRNPNAKVPDTALPALHKQFGSDKKLAEQAALIPVRMATILGEGKGKKKVQVEGTPAPQHLSKRKRIALSRQKTEIPTAPSPKKTPRLVTIKAINRPSRIITESFDKFKTGVLFTKDILFNGKPVSVENADLIIKKHFQVGQQIPCHIYEVSPDVSTAFLCCDIADLQEVQDKTFTQLKIGSKYPVRLEGTTPNYFLVSIVDTKLYGLVLKNQFDEGAVFDSHGNIKLQLVEKPESPFQLLRFVKPISAQRHIDVGNLDELVNNFLYKTELDAITPDDLDVVKSILGRFPELKRKKADQITGVQLYCRIPEKSPMNYFIKQDSTYFARHSFWVSVNQEDEENPSIALFTESPTVVIELKAFSDDVFTVAEFDSRKTNLTRNILQKYNKRTRLKIAGTNLHFITRYDPVPSDYNTEDVVDFLGKLYYFNSSIIPSIHEAIREKTLLSAKDYSILSSFLKFQRNKEYEKESESIFISPGRVDTSSTIRIGDHPSLRLKLFDNEVEMLIGSSEEESGAFHVAVVDEDGEEILTGVLDTEGEDFVLRFDHGHVDLSEFLNAGIRLQRRANIKHIQIQMNAIEDFVRRDSLKIYQDLINNRLETPDMSQAEGVEFKNPLFYTAAGDNTQSEAVKKALGNKNVLLIQGPPGTGKTTIIVEIIEQLVARRKKVLVCSQAHAAVKNIYDRLQARCPEMELLALDEKDEVTAAARNFDDEAYTQFLKNNLAVIGAARKGADKAGIDTLINSFTYKSPERTKDFRKKHHHVVDYREVISSIPPMSITSLLERLKTETRDLNTDLLKAQVYREKDVILGTCIGIGMDPVMRDKDAVHFDTVIVDEAGKANLAETIVPLQLGDRFILVGDHRQLPPYFDREEIAEYRESVRNNTYSQNFSQPEVEKAMNKSLFSDFFDHQYFPNANKVTLNYQFRMNPQIGQYISDLFYGGQLLSGKGTEKQTVSVEGYSDPVTFVDTFVYNINEENDPRETKSPDGSVYNMREVKDICEKVLPSVSVALDSNPELTVGIITPYKAQYRKLCEALKDSRFKDSIYTIDSIQGSEFDIVVFSFVRAFSSRSNKKVGFLDDLRRLNVSLSRAKKKLILVGHLPTLKNPAAHIEAPIPGMVSPVEVFTSIASRIKRYGELSPIERFMSLNLEEGHIFKECDFHDDGQPFIVIHLDGFDLTSRVSPKGFNKYNDGDSLEVILSGYDATGRPLFDSADLYYFKQNHKEGEVYEAIVSRSFQKEDGWKVVYAKVDGFELPLNLPNFLREEHPEYMVEETKLMVMLGHNEEDPDKLFFKPYRTDAERILGSPHKFFMFSATVVGLEDYPTITLQCNDGSQLSLSCPILWHTAVEDEKYELVLLNDGKCKLNDDYYFNFIKGHHKGARYKGLVVSEDNDNYYVEVDNYCGIVEKQWNRKRGIEMDVEYPVEISWEDNVRKLVKFKFV